jgi:hypothetical protein
MLAIKLHTQENNPKENIRNSKHGESLKSRASHVHHQEDYIVHAALYGMFSMHLCKQSTRLKDVLDIDMEHNLFIQLSTHYYIP